jgi:hypothetical protein
MATVYKIEIKTVSLHCNYHPDYIEKIFKDFLRDFKDGDTGLKFTNTEIKVERLS